MKPDETVVRRGAGLSFLFAHGHRPDAAAIAALASGQGDLVGFSISHRPAEHPYWLELLALGLTFDLAGLAPGVHAQVDRPAHGFAMPAADAAALEAVVIRPGPHLAAGGTLLPVIRAMAAIGCELARLDGVAGVGWLPAGTVMSPDYYLRAVGGWLRGGAFPALGLTALVRTAGGDVRSDGLSFFVGHELALETLAGESPADTSKLALRLIHHLVENGPYSTGPMTGPGGEPLHCEFTANASILRITRTAATGR